MNLFGFVMLHMEFGFFQVKLVAYMGNIGGVGWRQWKGSPKEEEGERNERIFFLFENNR